MVYLLHRPTQLGEVILLNRFALHLGVDMSGHHYSIEVAEEGRRGREKIEEGGEWRRKRRREGRRGRKIEEGGEWRRKRRRGRQEREGGGENVVGQPRKGYI